MKNLIIFLILLLLAFPAGASSWTDNFTLEIPYEGDRDTLDALSGDLEVIDSYMGKLFSVPSGDYVQTITATTDTISIDAGTTVISADYGCWTLQSTPTIRDGWKKGEIVIIYGAPTLTWDISIQDQDTLGGSNIHLGTSQTIDIQSNDVQGFMWNGWDWIQILSVDN